MNFKTTLFLLVLVVVVGVSLYIVTNREDKTKTPDTTDTHKLITVDSADVVRVSITASDDRHLVLQKTGSQWRLVEPVAAPAKSFEVDDLVRALVSLQSHEQLDDSKKTAGGLDHPSFTVELTTKSNATTKLAFGDNSAVGDSLYVLVNDASKPNIVGNSIYATLDKPASAYRDMKLVSTSSSDVKQLAITSKGRTIRLEKTGENWEVTEPEKMPAETSAVTDLLSSITGLEASSFVESPKPLVLASLSHPRLMVTFSTQAPATQPAASQPATTQASAPEIPGGQTLRFGSYTDIQKKDLFASLDDKEVAVVPATAEKSFEKTPLDLRNRDVVSIAPDRVSSFTITMNRPATTQPTTLPAEMSEFTIERHKVAPPVLGPTLPGGLSVPAAAPTSGSATQPAAAGAAPSTTQPASTQPSTTQPAAASSASDTGASAATTASSQLIAATVPTTLPATVPTSVPTTLPLTPLTPATVPAVATTLPAATQPDELASAKWIFTSGKTGAADEGQVNELLSSLQPLRAEKYLEPEKVTGTTYTLTVHVIPASAADAAQDYVLTFIDTGGRIDGFYKDLHFTVDRALLDKLTGDFKTRKAAPAPSGPPPRFPGRCRRLTLRRITKTARPRRGKAGE